MLQLVITVGNMSAHYITTKRNSKKLVDENFSVFELHKKSAKVIYWRCELCYIGCKSRVHTTASSLNLESPEIIHRSAAQCQHPNDGAKVAARSVVSRIKSAVGQTVGPTRDIINSALAEVNIHDKTELPSMGTLSRNVRKWRNLTLNAPAVPLKRTGFNFPESISLHPDGTKFLVHDSGSEDKE